HLTATLPRYMVPAAFVTIDTIPLTANGKLDHRALPAPERSVFASADQVAPRNPVEERIAAIWSQVLNLPAGQVSVEDSFFDLGGDSIRAVQLSGALRQAGYDLSIQQIFQHRTIAALAQHAADSGPVTDTEPVAPFALVTDEDRAALPADVVDAYPLSQVQTGMIVEMLAENDHASYHNINSYSVPDDQPFSSAALTEALAVVAARHDVLRTSVQLAGYSQPLQLVHAEVEIPLSVHDLRELTADERRADELALLHRERAALFDLATAPLMRLNVHLESDRSWRLTFTQCHAITDGWSVNSLLMELLEAYRCLRDGVPLTLPQPPAVRYADFIAAELECLDGEKSQAFWQDITSLHAPLTMPAGWQGDATPGENYRLEVVYDDLESGLRGLAAAARTSLKSVLLAAHVKVLGMLTTEPAFHTGLVAHGRLEATGGDRVLGMHLNTVPFPADRSARTWRELVEQVFDQETAIWGHRRYPLPAIQRNTGGSERLLDVMFDYQDFHQVDTGSVDIQANVDDAFNDFAMTVLANPGRLGIATATNVIDRANGERLVGMYRRVLEAMAADPTGDARATYLPETETTQLLEEWNPAHVIAGEECVHHAFEHQAAATPDALALTFEDTHLTYAQLNERANRIAHHLIEQGATPETLVAVCLERGIDLIPTILGVLKSGAGYLPLDPSNPVERLGYILGHARAQIVVTQQQHTDLVSTIHQGRTIVLDSVEDATTIEARSTDNPSVDVRPDNLIYVIYTSGSTGTPKGVTLTHANVWRLLASVREQFAFGADDVWTLFHSYAFDVSVWEMWGALLHGGRLVVAPFEVLRSPHDFLDLMITQRATILCQTPTAFRSLTTLAADGDPRIDELTLRAVVFAGEKLEIGDLAPWTDRLGSEMPALVNMYGITETTVHSTYHQVTAADLANPHRNPVGSPLADLAIHLLDERGHLVPVGIPGEIHVAGPGVARGYLNRPDLTAERFIPDPWGEPGARMYRSGDLARRLADGTLEFLGRIDTQVKIRGYRVELGEIQAKLTEHPDVHDAVVTAYTDTTGQKSLVAHLVPTTHQGPDAGELRKHLAQTLPDYMVPAAFVAIEEIPLTPNGKLDHRALPAPERSAFAASAHVAPRTPVEERVTAVWAQVLDLPTDQVSVEDSFFDLGGDSIRAVRLSGALRQAGYDLSIQQIFQHRTIAALAQHAACSGPVSTEPVAPFSLIGDEDRAALPADVVDAYPLSQIQTGMIVEMLAGNGRNVYHNVNTQRLPGQEPFSATAFRKAVRTIGLQQDVLRTSVHLTGYSQPLQLVHGEVNIPIAIHDLRHLGSAEKEKAGLEFVARERAELFDLATGPLLRFAVHLEEDDVWRFTVTYCHAILEGWSNNTLLMDLLNVYQHYRAGGEELPVEPLPVRYADFIGAELDSLDSEADQAFWHGIVDTHMPVTLPADWADRDKPMELYRVQVPFLDLETELRQLAREAKTSLKSVLLAAHLKALGMLTPEPAYHTGLVAHGRMDAVDSDRVLGMHLNTVPFPMDRSARTWRELVQQVFEQETATWEHRRYPLPAIQRHTGSDERLLTILFDYLDFHQVDRQRVDVGAVFRVSINEFALNIIATGGNININGATNVLSRENAERLAQMYRRVLEAMAADPSGDARATYLPETETVQLLEEWNPAHVITGEECVHHAFERQAATTPDALALTYEGTHLTYRELNERANKIAHHLIEQGAAPETLVAVCLERGIDLIPTILGVLKSGAGYLPLDPSNPVERLGYILGDARAAIAIT
ncbi:amino acid adenylation domain-containing protein, partial [Kitasatospora sp. NPDC058115]|uniref:amino acid adenylation domain-containing protein n=1 Tax=Kitasatospora sp. NPDC058115 TaxID=3346347 RepID=UPI0036DB25B8